MNKVFELLEELEDPLFFEILENTDPEIDLDLDDIDDVLENDNQDSNIERFVFL